MFSVKDSSFNFIDTVKVILQKAVILIFGWLDMLVFIVCYWIRHVPKHCPIMCSSLEDLNYLIPENVLFSIDPFTCSLQVIYCTSLNWSADGSTLFSGYTDGVVRVWGIGRSY